MKARLWSMEVRKMTAAVLLSHRAKLYQKLRK